MAPYLDLRRHRSDNIVAKDSTGKTEDGNPLVLWSGFGSQTSQGDLFNTFSLIDGHLRHNGLGKWVVAKDSTGRGGNGNPLVLWSSYGSQTVWAGPARLPPIGEGANDPDGRARGKLESIFEADFFPVSYGFRPGKSVHGALECLRVLLRPKEHKTGQEPRLPYQWVVEGTIPSLSPFRADSSTSSVRQR